MKKSVYKPGTLLVASLFLLSSALTAQEVSKEYHKEYKANKSTALELNNRYGDIVVETTQTDQVVINVKVSVRYPNEERANKLLGYIDVQFSEDTDMFEAKTNIDDKFNFTGWGGESRKFRIDYKVQMPESMSLTLVNRYGSTDLDDMSGFVDLDVKYGSLDISKLSRGNEKPLSSINVAYGNCTIEEAGWLDITARYSENFTVNKAQALILDNKYSNINIGSVSSIVAETSYKNLRIDNINNLVLNGDYTEVNIGTLNKKLVLDAGYGSLNIDRIPSGFESIEVDTHYTAIRLGIDSEASYNLDARLTYGGLKYNEDNFQNKRRIVENNSTEVSGTVGKEASPNANVKIKATYASVKLY
jgi:hypothetical protein